MRVAQLAPATPPNLRRATPGGAVRPSPGDAAQPPPRDAAQPSAAPDVVVEPALVRTPTDEPPNAVPPGVDGRVQIISYYGYRQNNAKLDWYLTGNQEVNYSDLPRVSFDCLDDKYDYLMAVLDRRHLDPIAFDMTPTGMTNCRLVKVFMPELTQPFLQSKPILGHPRFAEAARLLGRGEQQLPLTALTVDPLPYP